MKKTREENVQYVFSDTSFPANEESLYFKYDSNKWKNIEWKRPHVSIFAIYVVKT